MTVGGVLAAEMGALLGRGPTTVDLLAQAVRPCSSAATKGDS